MSTIPWTVDFSNQMIYSLIFLTLFPHSLSSPIFAINFKLNHHSLIHGFMSPQVCLVFVPPLESLIAGGTKLKTPLLVLNKLCHHVKQLIAPGTGTYQSFLPPAMHKENVPFEITHIPKIK